MDKTYIFDHHCKIKLAFFDQTLKTIYGDSNIRVLIVLQQSISSKFKLLLMIRFRIQNYILFIESILVYDQVYIILYVKGKFHNLYKMFKKSI